MIRIKIKCHDSRIAEMCVKGHSGYAEAGKDLVCAAVSSIMFGLLNALDQQCSDRFEAEITDRIVIKANGTDEKTQIILKTGWIQLKTVEESYPDFIKIQIQEV